MSQEELHQDGLCGGVGEGEAGEKEGKGVVTGAVLGYISRSILRPSISATLAHLGR